MIQEVRVTEKVIDLKGKGISLIDQIKNLFNFGGQMKKVEVQFANEKVLKAYHELNDKDLKNLILERLKLYNPFISILDKLIKYKENSKKFSEKDITKDLKGKKFPILIKKQNNTYLMIVLE